MKKCLSFFMIICFMMGMLTTVHAETVTLSLNRDSLTLSVGRYVTVYASVSPSGAMRDAVTYTTNDETIASVNQEGKVRALHVGECTLTATSQYDESISTSIPVRVIIPVEDVQIVAAEPAVVLGHTLQLSIAVQPANATMQGVTYTSTDPSIASVTQAGLVTGLRHGETVIKVLTEDGRADDAMRITVKQPPESVSVSPSSITVAEGKTAHLKATVLPSYTDDKTVLWSSADPVTATVSDRGVVTGVLLGQTTITASCKDNPDATFQIPVRVLKLAQSVSFDQPQYDILVGDKLQLNHTVFPASTSNQAVTYKVGNSRIATIDENGMVTAVKGGTTTVTVTTADGSRKSGTAAIRVIVPVTGVSYPRSDIRVGEGYYGHFTVNLEPSNATNHAMSWITEDPSIATVTGDTNTFKIVGGDTWGRTTVTGTTADGNHTITLNVNVGSLRRTISVRSLEIKDGKPYLTLQNNSGMVITQVRYFMQGLDADKNPIQMSLSGDPLTLYGTYDLPLYPGERTQHGVFTFNTPSDYPNLTYLCIVITGWKTSTGYYDSNGNLQYDYPIPADYQQLIVYPADTDPAEFLNHG